MASALATGAGRAQLADRRLDGGKGERVAQRTHRHQLHRSRVGVVENRLHRLQDLSERVRDVLVETVQLGATQDVTTAREQLEYLGLHACEVRCVHLTQSYDEGPR